MIEENRGSLSQNDQLGRERRGKEGKKVSSRFGRVEGVHADFEQHRFQETSARKMVCWKVSPSRSNKRGGGGELNRRWK